MRKAPRICKRRGFVLGEGERGGGGKKRAQKTLKLRGRRHKLHPRKGKTREVSQNRGRRITLTILGGKMKESSHRGKRSKRGEKRPKRRKGEAGISL